MKLGIVLLLAIVSCGWDKPNPAAFKPTQDNPCGNLGVTCLDMNGKYDHMCCDEGETCGGGKYSVGCPAGECCDIREPPAFLNRTDAGATSFKDDCNTVTCYPNGGCIETAMNCIPAPLVDAGFRPAYEDNKIVVVKHHQTFGL